MVAAVHGLLVPLFGSAACSRELPLSEQTADLVNSTIGAECGAAAFSRYVGFGMSGSEGLADMVSRAGKFCF
jgi:hypothetical protein